jgi:hypothetical protein
VKGRVQTQFRRNVLKEHFEARVGLEALCKQRLIEFSACHSIPRGPNRVARA